MGTSIPVIIRGDKLLKLSIETAAIEPPNSVVKGTFALMQ